MQISPPSPAYSFQNSTVPSVADTATELSSKVKTLIVAAALTSSDNDKPADEFLKMLLIDILFGSPNDQTVSPTEQAQMINDVLSSGEPGAVSRAMAMTGGGTAYTASGAVSTNIPVGAGISVSA